MAAYMRQIPHSGHWCSIQVGAPRRGAPSRRRKGPVALLPLGTCLREHGPEQPQAPRSPFRRQRLLCAVRLSYLCDRLSVREDHAAAQAVSMGGCAGRGNDSGIAAGRAGRWRAERGRRWTGIAAPMAPVISGRPRAGGVAERGAPVGPRPAPDSAGGVTGPAGRRRLPVRHRRRHQRRRSQPVRGRRLVGLGSTAQTR